jgi:hypothetical protein
MDYLTVPHNPVLPNQKYDYGQAKKINDLITTEFVKSLKLKPANLDQNFKRGIRVQRQFCQKIFISGIKHLLLHCMETNKKFVSPMKPRFTIHIRNTAPGNLRRILNNGKIYRNVDFFETDFQIKEFCLTSWQTKESSYGIRIGYTMYRELVERINNGMKYQDLGIFSTGVLLDKLEDQYPTIGRSVIRQILEFGFYQMHYYLIENEEIFIKSIGQCLQFIVYHFQKRCR